MIILTLLLLFGLTAHSKPIDLEHGGVIYKIEIPDNFTFHKTFLSLENVVMSPADPKLGTSSLSLKVTGLADANFDPKELEKSQHRYQEGRKNYISKRNLNLVDFIPYELKKTKEGIKVHAIGVVYSNETKVTLDKTYLVECPQSFMFSKFVGDVAIISETAAIKKQRYNSPAARLLETAILSLKCGK